MKPNPISIEEAVQHLEEYQKEIKELQCYKGQFKTLGTDRKSVV